MSRIHQINTEEEFRQKLSSAPANSLTVVDFTATWCGPCRMIAPVFEKFSREFQDVQFLKVDVDKVAPVAQAAGVTSILSGADPNGLRNLLVKHAGSNNGGGGGSSSDAVDCLNQHGDHGVRNLFDKSNHLETVKLHSIKISAVLDRIDQAPKKIKLYANVRTLGFEEAEGVSATQTLELTRTDYEQDVFVESNQSEDEDTPTLIDRIQLIGSPVETTRMENLKPMSDGH
ncbi:thioredoxin-like protein [Syncephalis plumigaleata]|nr:thioredoxin-like protein [Syncephalis plumigaleata]